MRITILKDKKISKTHVQETQRQFEDFLSDFDIQWFVHDRDYVFYPTFTDKDGDKRPTNKFLKDESDFVFKKYGRWGTDHVVILIDKDHWQSPTIWGTNYSNIFHGYQVHYCRKDTRVVNTVGTVYHEIMHSFDALVKTETGIDVAKYANVENWDKDVVHGRGRYYDYIQYNENLEAVDYIASWLKKSYANRQARFDKEYGLLKNVVSLLQTLVVLLRQQTNRKNGVKK